LALAKERKGKTVFVSAEAGMGKTRLMREFLNTIHQENNVVTISGWCLFNAGIRYFPFIEAFSNHYSTLGEKSGEEVLEISAWLKEPAKTGLQDKFKYLSPQAIKYLFPKTNFRCRGQGYSLNGCCKHSSLID